MFQEALKVQISLKILQKFKQFWTLKFKEKVLKFWEKLLKFKKSLKVFKKSLKIWKKFKASKLVET